MVKSLRTDLSVFNLYSITLSSVSFGVNVFSISNCKNKQTRTKFKILQKRCDSRTFQEYCVKVSGPYYASLIWGTLFRNVTLAHIDSGNAWAFKVKFLELWIKSKKVKKEVLCTDLWETLSESFSFVPFMADLRNIFDVCHFRYPRNLENQLYKVDISQLGTKSENVQKKAL